MPRGSAWTDEEQRIFKAAFPHVGAAGVHELLPNRSEKAIQQRAGVQRVHMVPKDQRRTLEDLKREFGAKPKEKRMALGPGGTQFEWGTTAGTKAGPEKVPESAEKLPWVSYPRDPNTARAVAAACEYMAHSSDAVKKVGLEAQRFFESQAAYLRALANRMDPSTQPVTK